MRAKFCVGDHGNGPMVDISKPYLNSLQASGTASVCKERWSLLPEYPETHAGKDGCEGGIIIKSRSVVCIY